MEPFEALYRENVRLVYGLMSARTGDAGLAEDLTQDTFLRAWRHFAEVGTLPAPAQRAWLVRTARNLAIDAWRRQHLATQAEQADPQATAAEDRGLASLRLDVAAALAKLDPSDRELVVLRYVEELNSREIGEVLDLPEGTVRRRLARCRELLSHLLAQWAREGDEA